MDNFEVGKDYYLAGLQGNNRDNLEILSRAFLAQLIQEGETGALIAVGGTVKPENRGTSRKDIDVYAAIDHAGGFDKWRDSIAEIARRAGIEISKIQPPIPDIEYSGIINIHDGSMTLNPSSGVPIEIVNSESWLNSHQALAALRSGKLPFSILLIKD
jgi:hypothetical protein